MTLKLFSLAIKSLRFRKFSVGLTIFSLAISIMLLFGVDTIRVQTKSNFINTISGTDLIVGSRSGSVQLLLYTVFHLGNATNNVSWDNYQKIIRHPRVSWSIPISLGDSHKGYRVIGTSQDYFSYYSYHKNRFLEFSGGRQFEDLFDVVIGANVAKELGYSLGDEIILAHGMGNISLAEHKNLPFVVSGILEPTASPVDNSLFVSLAGLEAVHIGWEHGVASKTDITTEDINKDDPRLQVKSITAFFLGLKSKHDIFNLQRAINDYKREPLLAIIPGVALLELWKILGVVEKVLLLIAGLVVVTGLLGMLAIILTNLNSRSREIAILRSVGASPLAILFMMIIETELLVLAGIIIGLGFMYTGLIVFNPILQDSIGLTIELLPPSVFQWIILGCILLAGFIISFIPAFSAYRRTLQDGLSIRS